MLEVKALPVVIVETWAGKTDDQKAHLIKGITRAFEEVGVPANQVQVIIHDVPKANWGMQGQQCSKLPP
jgi:4-oxalocrotonate tautomerase